MATLMFLPGASGNTALWKPIAAGLSHAGPRLFFGWPGFGDTPPDPGVRGLSDLVDRVAAEIQGPTILFAQSMGGVIAIQAALSRPHDVRGLVLSVTSGGIDMSAVGGLDWRPSFATMNPDLPRWFLDERQDLSARLPQVAAPALLLWGDADPISPVAAGRRLAELLPRAELIVVEGGTHDLALERAGDVLPHIARFLAKTASSDSGGLECTTSRTARRR